MRPETLDASIKTRLPAEQKEQLQQLARQRHLKPADLIREALRLYIAERTQPQPQEAGR